MCIEESKVEQHTDDNSAQGITARSKKGLGDEIFDKGFHHEE
jgi:hypothetical protein